MKASISAVALLLGLAGSADAATRTFQAVFTGLIASDGALAALGADPLATQMVFKWSFDDTVPPIAPPVNYSDSNIEYDYVFDHYQSFDVSVGGVTLSGPASVSGQERIFVQDGVRDALGGSVVDYFQVGSFSSHPGPNGTVISSILLQISNADFSVFGRAPGDPLNSGLGHPSADELNALASSGIVSSQIYFYDTLGASQIGSGTVSFSELTPVPLPAGLPLLAGALGLVGMLRRRKAA